MKEYNAKLFSKLKIGYQPDLGMGIATMWHDGYCVSVVSNTGDVVDDEDHSNSDASSGGKASCEAKKSATIRIKI